MCLYRPDKEMRFLDLSFTAFFYGLSQRMELGWWPPKSRDQQTCLPPTVLGLQGHEATLGFSAWILNSKPHGCTFSVLTALLPLLPPSPTGGFRKEAEVIQN